MVDGDQANRLSRTGRPRQVQGESFLQIHAKILDRSYAAWIVLRGLTIDKVRRQSVRPSPLLAKMTPDQSAGNSPEVRPCVRPTLIATLALAQLDEYIASQVVGVLVRSHVPSDVGPYDGVVSGVENSQSFLVTIDDSPVQQNRIWIGASVLCQFAVLTPSTSLMSSNCMGPGLLSRHHDRRLRPRR